jgi:hypothetical protein
MEASRTPEERKVMFIFGWVFVIFPLVGIWFLAEDVSERRARTELQAALAASSTVYANGQPLPDPAPVLAALRGVTHVPAHHSSPTKAIYLRLTAGARTVAVIIARDSENPSEFWVYRPGRNWHNDPLGQDAGRVVSSELNAYLRQRGL